MSSPLADGLAGARLDGQRRGTGPALSLSPPSKLKLLVEPGGAAALAALLAGKLEAKTVALVLSGGNADFSTVANAVGAHAP